MVKNYFLKIIIFFKIKKNLEVLTQKRKYFYPLAEPTYDHKEVMQAVDSMVTYRTTMYEKVKYFEKLFGEKYGGEAIMVNSGSSADLLISFALSEKTRGPLPLGSEILIPAVTWPTHLWSPLMAGFDVKLIDINPSTLNFDLEMITKSITKKTRAIFIVHLLGNVGKIKELAQICKDRDIILLEDCCEALGSKYNGQYVGTFGLASSFSFFFSHHLVTMEGGMILTQDVEFAKKIRLLRSHGWAREIQDYEDNLSVILDKRYTFLSWGFNLRPTEIQAGFGIEQIQKIDDFQAARVQNSQLLLNFVGENSDFISTMEVDSVTECSWFAFPLIIKRNAPFSKTDFANHLEKFGVETRPIVAGNLARQPAVKDFTNIVFEELPGSDYIHDYGLYIGIHPTTKSKDLKKAIKVMNDYLFYWRNNG